MALDEELNYVMFFQAKELSEIVLYKEYLRKKKYEEKTRLLSKFSSNILSRKT